jgi:hypothetical protein
MEIRKSVLQAKVNHRKDYARMEDDTMSETTSSKNSELRPIEYTEAVRAWIEALIRTHQTKPVIVIDSLQEFDEQQISRVTECSADSAISKLNESAVPSRFRGKAKYKHEGKYYVRHPVEKHRK